MKKLISSFRVYGRLPGCIRCGHSQFSEGIFVTSSTTTTATSPFSLSIFRPSCSLRALFHAVSMSVPNSGPRSTLNSYVPCSPVLSRTGIGEPPALAGTLGRSAAGIENWTAKRPANRSKPNPGLKSETWATCGKNPILIALDESTAIFTCRWSFALWLSRSDRPAALAEPKIRHSLDWPGERGSL